MFTTLPGRVAARPGTTVPPWCAHVTPSRPPRYPQAPRQQRRQRCPARTACPQSSTSWCSCWGLTGSESNPASSGPPFTVFKIEPSTPNAYFMPGADPGEGYMATNDQLFGTDTAPASSAQAPSNDGFVKDFAYTLGWQGRDHAAHRRRAGRGDRPGGQRAGPCGGASLAPAGGPGRAGVPAVPSRTAVRRPARGGRRQPAGPQAAGRTHSPNGPNAPLGRRRPSG